MTTSTGRQSPTAQQLRAWRLFVETSERVSTRIGSRLQTDSGISSGDYAVLLALVEADDTRLRSSTLAERIDWERSRLSHHLGRMERRGLITRENCATDTRGSEVVLTSEGAAQFRRASAPHLHAIQQMFVSALSPEQLIAIEQAMVALDAHLSDNA